MVSSHILNYPPRLPFVAFLQSNTLGWINADKIQVSQNTRKYILCHLKRHLKHSPKRRNPTCFFLASNNAIVTSMDAGRTTDFNVNIAHTQSTTLTISTDWTSTNKSFKSLRHLLMFCFFTIYYSFYCILLVLCALFVPSPICYIVFNALQFTILPRWSFMCVLCHWKSNWAGLYL